MITGGSSSSDLEMEQSEEFKAEEMRAIEKFVEKRKLEVSLINDKYEGQVK